MFNRTKGFGFSPEATAPRHLHSHGNPAPLRLTELRPGQTVLVRFGDGDKGLMAAEIHPTSPRPWAARIKRSVQTSAEGLRWCGEI